MTVIALAQPVVAGSINIPGTQTVNYGSNVTKGNLLCAVGINGGATFLSATDTVGSQWRVVQGHTADSVILWAVSGGSGANTVSVVTGGGPDTGADFYIFEIKGFAGTPQLLRSSITSGSSSTPSAGPLAAPANAFLLAGIRFAGTATGGGSGWTAIVTPNVNLVEYVLGTTAGSFTATGTPADTGWVDTFAVFSAENSLFFGCNS